VTNREAVTEPMAVELAAGIGITNADADRSWQLAISLIAAWRGPDRERAVAQRLGGLAAEGDPIAPEQAILGLTALGNMFLELYADLVGSSTSSVLQEAATLTWDGDRNPA
jgi:hypothetical protein